MGATEYATRDEWLAARGIGSSDAAAILGADTQRGPFAAWARLAHGSVEVEDEQEPADLVCDPRHWGHAFENVIASQGYNVLHPSRALVDPGAFTLYRHAEFPHITASPDLLVHCPVKGPGVLEVKYYSPFNSGDWDVWPPLWVQLQLQHQLLVTGLRWGSICVLLGSTFKSWDIDAHPVIHKAMLDAYGTFWESVQSKTAPAIDAHESTSRAIARLYQTTDETTVLLPSEFAELDEEAEALARTIKMAEERRTEIRNIIRAQVAEHRCGIIEGTNVKYRIGKASESKYLKIGAGITQSGLEATAQMLTEMGVPFETKITTRNGAMTRSGGPKNKQLAADESPKEIANV